MEIRRISYDVIVVGSGAAGCAAARAAADAGSKVLLLSKDPLTASDTKIAEGIVAVRASSDASDSEKTLSLNMRIQGDNLSDPYLVNAFSKDSVSSYEWLIKEGLLSAINPQTGKPETLPLPLGGHDRKRSVDHKNGALDYAHALWNSVQRPGNIEIIEDAWAIDLIVDHSQKPGILCGLLAYFDAEGKFLLIRSKSVVLACGGASTLYFPCTDTMRGNSGDAYGMALRAGIALVDMEQVQFLPFGITAPASYEGLLAGEPVSCGPMGVLRDTHGKIILSELMVRTRAECAAAIATTVAQGNGTQNAGCWLDLTENMAGTAGPLFLKLMKQRAPKLLSTIRKALGPKAARYESWWEVRPTAHYFMGGILSDASGTTDLPGLFVAGQAMGGLHGSNRLGSTSLAEGAIFGLRSGEAAANFQPKKPITETECETLAAPLLQNLKSVLERESGENAASVQTQLQQSAFNKIGPARNEADLNEFSTLLNQLQQQLTQISGRGPKIWNQNFLDYLETRNLLVSALAICLSAKHRGHSLGAHIRTDATKSKVSKLQSITVAKNQNGQYQIKPIDRTPSPLLQSFRFKVQELLRLLRLKLLRRLPSRQRERILIKTYTGLLDHDKLSET